MTKAPASIAGAPAKPKDLSPEAAKEWDRVVPELAEAGVLAVLDRAALVIYCESWATYVSAVEQLREQGELIPGQKGNNLVRNPLLAVARDAAQLLRRMADELLITPSARADWPATDDDHDSLSIILGGFE